MFYIEDLIGILSKLNVMVHFLASWLSRKLPGSTSTHAYDEKVKTSLFTPYNEARTL